MTNDKIYVILLFFAVMYSCNTKVKSGSVGKEATLEKEFSSSVSQSEPTKEVKFMDTIPINYKNHKTLLNILKIVPNEAMRSWGWSKKDRIKTVDFIERNNYLIDSTEIFNTIKYIKPNTIGIQVVDGFWTMSIYKYTDNHYFIVTNDIVGDANDIQTYVYFYNKLIPTKMVNWFSDFDYKLLLDRTTNCIEALEDNKLGYSYDFKDKNKITISSWSLNKDEFKNCFKGNTITYKLNTETKTFDVVNVYWKSDENECETQNERTEDLDNKLNTNKTLELTIPEGYSELKESPSNGKAIEKVGLNFDNDALKDEALLIQNDSKDSNFKLLIYLTSSKKQYEVDLISTNDFGIYPMPLKTSKNVIEFGYFEDGTAAFGRFIKLRYHTEKEKIQVIGYDSGYRATPSLHIDKSYNLLTGKYSVKKTNFNDAEKGKIEEFSGKNEVFKKKVFLENFNLEMLINLDAVGSKYE